MRSNLFLPKKIKVGFNQRKETYSGYLGYVIGHDGKKWRKENSWEGWIEKHSEEPDNYKTYNDTNLIPKELDNTPLDGFVLNRKAGGTSYGWNTRVTKARVYDPRGFEVEISIDNLLYILEHYGSEPAKALNGKFVYAWDRADLILLPTESIDYKESLVLKEKKKVPVINSRKLKEGYIYLTKSGEEVVYMGKELYTSPYYTKKKRFWYCTFSDVYHYFKTSTNNIFIEEIALYDDYPKLSEEIKFEKYYGEEEWVNAPKDFKEKYYDSCFDENIDKPKSRYYSKILINGDKDLYFKKDTNKLVLMLKNNTHRWNVTDKVKEIVTREQFLEMDIKILKYKK